MGSLMIEVQPNNLVFRNVRQNTSYVSTVVITNTLASPVDITFTVSSNRYTITPATASLNSNESIAITVKLKLVNFYNIKSGLKGVKDFLSLKSTFFEQKIPLTFFLAKPNAIDSPAASGSNPNHSQYPASNSNPPPNPNAQLIDQSVHFSRQIESLQMSNNSLSQSLRDQQQENQHLRNMLENVNQTVPNVQALVDEQIRRERLDFENRSEKVRGQKKPKQHIYS